MIKLDSISRWNLLARGSKLTLKGDAPRRIRLNVNSPKRISLYLVNDETGELQFLASPDGLEIVEFYAGGVVHITTEDEDVYVYTAEKEPTFTIIEDAETFTRIAERAARNPDLEHMMYQASLNMDRRFAALEQDIARREREAFEAGRALVNPDISGKSPAENDAGQAKPNTDESASGAGTGEAASGADGSAGQNPPDGQSAPAGEQAAQ